MKAEIISIGSEILRGQITDTNANFIAKKLVESGIDLEHISAASDNPESLLPTLKLALQRSDLIITTGGLGPTEDDITYQTIASALNLKLIKYPEAEENLKRILKKINRRISPSNLKQVYLPEGAKIIINQYGTAPAMILEKDNKIICSFPGVPYEMKNLIEENLIPYLKEKFPPSMIKKSKILKITGLGESSVNELICDYMSKQTNFSFGIYANPEDIQVQVTTQAPTEKEVEKLLQSSVNQLTKILGNYIYGSDEETIEEVVGNLLKTKKLKVAVAESCTGGMLGEMITRIPGSSEYFQGGVISYNARIKEDLLKVSSKVIRKYGEVSRQVAKLIAEGVRRCCHSNIGISITGIAGPGGATEKKKVGLVYMALSDGKKTITQKHQLFGSRQLIRLRSARRALNMLRMYLIGK
ncbi:MAG TPA: competence/damage-inducible protein A [Candidatus Atribacteria bacterium]|nr:MAG: Putative competence-damage inducible protein [Atribacteria bacterium 34_128]HAJ33771.1 competence/damage-inducible protein A [Candidatus Atribacteria bacterium]